MKVVEKHKLPITKQVSPKGVVYSMLLIVNNTVLYI